MLFFGVIGGGVLIALIVGALIFFGGKTQSKADLTTLSVRLSNIQSITDDSRKNIVSSRLRATNTALSLALTNANRDIIEFLPATGGDKSKVDPKITSQESTEELMKTLDDARLNGIFDRIYAREMSYKLDTTLILITQLESKTKNSSQRAFLTATHKNLAPLQEQFSEFNTTTN